MIKFYTDIGSNYITSKGPSFDRAIKLIDYSAKAGCTGVKFQYFRAKNLWNKKVFPNEYYSAEKCELPFDWIESLSNRARKQGLLFGLSVFDEKDVNLVNDWIDYFKIASFEIGLFNLIKKCYLTKKSLMLSLGQSDEKELMNIIANLPGQESTIDIFHCSSKYPSNIEDCNLNIIKYKPYINGWSDHTTSEAVIFGAINCGAELIEFHLDDGLGLESKHSWTPWRAGSLIKTVRDMEKSYGSGKWDDAVKLQDRKYKANPKTGLRG